MFRQRASRYYCGRVPLSSQVQRKPRERVVEVVFGRSGFLPERSADVSGEQAVYDRVGRGVQRRETLDERGERYVRLRFRYVAVHLKQIEHYVRAPAQDEHCKTNVSIMRANALG